MDAIKNIKVIKRKGDKIICFSFVEDRKRYFGKLIHTDLQTEFARERDINTYLNNNITTDNDFRYFTRMLKVFENIPLPNELASLVTKLANADGDAAVAKYNLMVFTHAGNRPLRYYINRLSRESFKDVLKQLRDATALLNKIGVIHYDLYCESNVMLKKEKNEWVIKIIDFGLSYIDLTDDSDSDYKNILESIECFNNKHINI
uniref:Protein kinase domain-containing protein n=1 Tax=viral metagenome TaxID=1070528 RepID=A0A6C0K952_9ZZZZ